MHGGAGGGQRRYLGIGSMRFEILLAPSGEGGRIMGGGIAGVEENPQGRRLAWRSLAGWREGNLVCEGGREGK